MNPSGWLKRWLRFRTARNESLRSLLAVLEPETPAQERGARLEEVLSHPQGAADLQALADLRRRQGPVLEELESLALTDADVEPLRRAAAGQIRALRSSRRGSRKAALLLVPAAAAVLLAVLALATFRRSAPIPDTERAGRFAAFEALLPHGEVERADLEFRWAPVKGAKHFSLEIFDHELSPVYRKDLIEGETFRLPADIAARLESGGRYFWRVTALLEGIGRVESGFEKFRISGI